MYPTSVAIGGRKMVEGSSRASFAVLGRALDSDFLSARSCSTRRVRSCSGPVQHEVLGRVRPPEHVSREPLYAAVREGRSAALPAELGGRLGLGEGGCPGGAACLC